MPQLYNSSVVIIISISFLNRYGTDNLPTVIDDLSCSLSSYLTIFQCSYSSSIDSGCSDDNDVAVTCCKSMICVDYCKHKYKNVFSLCQTGPFCISSFDFCMIIQYSFFGKQQKALIIFTFSEFLVALCN